MNLLTNEFLNEELIFQNIEGKLFKELMAPKIIIKYSVIRDSTFFNVDMRNCDFLSSKIYNVTFKNVSFSCADIYSLWFAGCKFENVNFSGAGIEDITFIDCHFDDCIFEDVGLKRCIFTNTYFTKIEPTSSGFVLNQYNNCIFKECIFNGSFQYQIFDDCKFENVKMDYSVLKYNFGINLRTGILYVKNNLSLNQTPNLYELLIDECMEQKLFLNAAFVNFDFASSINPKLLLKSIDAIELMLAKEVLIRNDELLYLRRLYQYMYEKHMIAPIVIYQLLNKIKNINSLMHSNIAYVKSNEALSLIYNDLYFRFCEFCDDTEKLYMELPKFDTPLELYIDYEQEPTMPLADLLNNCLPQTFERVQSGYGSFHEIITMLPQGLEILNIFLQILGICVPIIYAESKEKKQKANTTLEKTVDFNISSQKNTKDAAKVIQQTCKTIAASGLLDENLQGYNNSNIKEIKIRYNVNIQL